METSDYLNPVKLIQGGRRRFLRWVSRQLRPFLAQTPLYWGDKKRVQIGEDVILQNAIINSRSGRVVIEDHVFFGYNRINRTS